MPREHRPPPPPAGNMYNPNANPPYPNPTAGPYGPRNTLSSSEPPPLTMAAGRQGGVSVVDLSITSEKQGTPKFGETSPLRSKIGIGGNSGSMGIHLSYTS